MKRYVMLEDKTIVDTKERNLTQAGIRIMPDKTQQEYIDNKKVIRHTDNLLDLLEVGDIVELEPPHEYFIIKNEFYKKSAIDRQFNIEFNIVAIWKRNGDIMRRYVV